MSELRQAINKIELVGEVKEHKLKVNKNKDGNYINGSLVIKTGEFSEIEIGTYVTEKNKDGKLKKTYETLEKFINEDVITLASAKNEEDRNNVAKVRIFGKQEFAPHLKEDIFKVKETGEVVTKLKFDMGFGSIVIDNSIQSENYQAKFDVEMYVTEVKEEIKNDEETGRTIVKGWIPAYGGKVFPLSVVVGIITDDQGEEFDFGAEVLSEVEEGSTINVWGDINYQSIITKTKKGGSLGKAKIEEHREYINELVAEGISFTEDEEKEFDGELIKKAKIERDNDIENKKNEEVVEEKKSTGLNKGSKGEKRARPNF